ncbi:MAG TPA: cyclic pyranopterin monophosphate synthase MoaC [Candidatus Polarisedimenticolaceae bacterium]|nr:cyclic pyranopterin monophosphate synthase MoaC [Candidatus Polarisedimenticolaceae bacterium]
MSGKLTHLDGKGRASMVDVSGKPVTARVARAEGRVRLNAAAFRAFADDRLAKGDAAAVVRLAGIQAAKRTDEWVPLCHAIPLDHLSIELEIDEEARTVHIVAEARARWSTGVEMEALVAVSGACLALYDMTKALDRGITIEQVRLIEKSGGRAGHWKRSGDG